MRQSKPSRATTVKRESVQGIDAPVEVRRHPGARRLTLRVSRTRRAVIVTLPVQCDLDEAGNFLDRHIAWVRERLDSLPRPVPFRHGSVIPLRGVPHRLVLGAPVSDRGTVALIQTEALAELHVAGRAEHGARRLKDWLSEEALRDLDQRVAIHARRLGVRPKRIAIRDQSSRWGSCSTTGVLSFSWRLVMAPPRILDYVAAHEVAHLAEMNHGPQFWALVARTMPELEEAKRWLQLYGMDLHRYAPADRG